MAFGLKNFLFKGDARRSENLPLSVIQALASWRASPAPELDDPHFHMRYVVIDVATSGMRIDEDELLGISAVGVRGGSVLASDSFALDFSADDVKGGAVDSQLTAFLTYAAKAPLVAFHVPFVSGFLERTYKERLAVDFQPQWIDLAWLLPSFFKEKLATPRPLDEWLEIFAIGGDQRRDTMENTLVLARLLQMVLVRANDQNILTAEKLVEQSKSTSFLRRNR
ncbi:MAG: hypothetical protein WCA83_03585 [Azonexus sp.]